MQLLYPWFLLGLASISIPTVIHLLQLRKPQRLLFTNINFIQEAELLTVRRRRLRYLAVLAARVLGLIALVVAFCQPFTIVKKNDLGVQSTNAVDVLVDNSASMQGSGEEQHIFSDAVLKAEQLGKIYPDASFRLLNYGNTVLKRSIYQTKLTALHLGSAESTVNKAIRIGFNASGSNSFYVFSDFQRTNFDPAVFKQISSSREIILVPEAGKPVGNVFVDSVWFDDAFLRVQTNLGLHVRFRNGGSEAVNNCPVKVFLESRQVAAFQISLGAAQSTVSVVQVQLPSQQLMRGRVVTGDAPVVFDNSYYFTAQTARIIRIMEIGLAPIAQSLYENEPLFNYSFATPTNIDYGALRKANLVLVREIPVVNGELRDALRAMVARGGSVAVVPCSTLSSHSSYQQLFHGLGLGRVDWIPLGIPLELHEVALPNANGPFFRDILGPQQRTVAMPRVVPVLRWARTGTDILRLRDGESYLAEFNSGIGKVYVFAAPFANEFSDFTAHALFVPVLYKLAMRSFRREQQPAYRLNQRLITLSLASVTNDSVREGQNSLRLVRDSAVWVPTQRVQGNEVRLGVPTGLEVPGFYQVQRAGKVMTTVAFNASVKESELATYSVAELREMVGPNRPNVRVLDGAESSRAALAQSHAERNGQPLWRYFLAIALVCLLAEALLLRFGQPRTGTVRVATTV